MSFASSALNLPNARYCTRNMNPAAAQNRPPRINMLAPPFPLVNLTTKNRLFIEKAGWSMFVNANLVLHFDNPSARSG
jgi:hypothetical protein